MSIKASSNVLAASYFAVSDARVKEIVALSEGADDLATLDRVRVTNYRYKDRVRHGDRVHKKVIAQEVEAVYPAAVRKTVDVVPSIYRMSSSVSFSDGRLTVSLDEPHNLQNGDTVRLIGEKGLRDLPVAEVLDATRFVFANYPAAEEKVFVFGVQVSDFRLVDYEALGALNISATQELHRIVNGQEARIGSLTSENDALEAELISLRAEVAEIRALMNR